ncbi:MAG: T9SS type A sorting domain-containing protein [Bacteroidia bacterium]
MTDKIYFKRFTLLAFSMLLMVGVSFAEGGDDDDKKGDDKSDKDAIVLAEEDSVANDDDDIDIINQGDDTLVYEDWDHTEDDLSGGDSNGKVARVGQSDYHFNPYSRQATTELLDQINPLKKEYRVAFTVFPNPTIDKININPEREPTSIRIADITGKEHMVSPFTPTLDVSHLGVGTYFIQLIYTDHVESRKFIKG